MKNLFILVLLICGVSFSFANEIVINNDGCATNGDLNLVVWDVNNIDSEITSVPLQVNYKKMTTAEITDFLGENWHKNGEKTKYLREFKTEMKGDTNADFYKDDDTDRVYLITNKSKYVIDTGDYLN